MEVSLVFSTKGIFYAFQESILNSFLYSFIFLFKIMSFIKYFQKLLIFYYKLEFYTKKLWLLLIYMCFCIFKFNKDIYNKNK